MKTLPAASIAASILLITGCLKPKVTSPNTATGTVAQPFDYQITATRNPRSFSAAVPPPRGLTADAASGKISGSPQEAGTFNVRLTARNSAGEGHRDLRLTVNPAESGDPIPGEPHPVVTQKELFITSPQVLNSPRASVGGSWHIRAALQRIAGPGRDVETFAQQWFDTWKDNDSLPGVDDTFSKRRWVAEALGAAWRDNRIRLIAIVNRIDLARFPENDRTREPETLGEGRFVYEVLDANRQSLPFTLIFEYKLPMEGGPRESLRTWATRWHRLGEGRLGAPDAFPEEYLGELEAATDRYSAHGNLNQIRSNEFLPPPTGAPQWELREFRFDGGQGRLLQTPVLLTPAFELNGTPQLAAFLNPLRQQILDGQRIDFPRQVLAAVAPVPTPNFAWTAPQTDARATFITSFNSCNGCHAGSTGTPFQHIGQRAPNLSRFLAGAITLGHPLPPESNTDTQHNEMEDRRDLLSLFGGDVPVSRRALLTTARTSELLKERRNRPH